MFCARKQKKRLLYERKRYEERMAAIAAANKIEKLRLEQEERDR